MAYNKTRATSNTPNNIVSVTDYGAVADYGSGNTDNTAAFQAAIDANPGGDIFVPNGRYLIKGTVNIDARGTALYGSPALAAGRSEINAGDGAKIICEYSGEDTDRQVWFNVTKSQCGFSYLQFYGTEVPNSNGVKIAITGRPDSSNADVDIKVHNCGFTNFGTCLEVKGRGTSFMNNGVSSTVYGVTVLYDGPFTGTNYIQNSSVYGNRGGIISDNRFHACHYCVNSSSTYSDDSDPAPMRSWIISNNSLDIGRTLLVATNGAIGCVISGNACAIPGFNYDVIRIEGRINNLSITGNTFTGANDTIEDSDTRRYNTAVNLTKLTECTGVTITGNTFSHFRKSAIITESDEADFVVKGISITGNIFDNINTLGDLLDSRGVYATAADHENFVMVSNVITNHNANNAVVSNGNVTFTDSAFDLNVISPDTVQPVKTQITFEGNIKGNIAGGSTSFYVDNNGVIRQTNNSSLFYRLTRPGSGGGLGITPVNDNGEYNIFFSPNGANAGAIVPGTDGTIALGTSSAKFSALFTTTLRSSDLILELDQAPVDVQNPRLYDPDSPETTAYSGNTLSVKEVIQDLQQRVADRDAVIADFTTRIEALEADHATMMNNNNSGGY